MFIIFFFFSRTNGMGCMFSAGLVMDEYFILSLICSVFGICYMHECDRWIRLNGWIKKVAWMLLGLVSDYYWVAHGMIEIYSMGKRLDLILQMEDFNLFRNSFYSNFHFIFIPFWFYHALIRWPGWHHNLFLNLLCFFWRIEFVGGMNLMIIIYHFVDSWLVGPN